MVGTLRDLGAVRGQLATTFHGADLTACLRDRPAMYRDLVRDGALFLPIYDYPRQRLLAPGREPARLASLRVGVARDRSVERPGSPAVPGPPEGPTTGCLGRKTVVHGRSQRLQCG